MNICLFTDEEINMPLKAKDERCVHIKKILKKKTGESFTAGIMGGPSGTAVITKIGAEGEPDEGQIYFSFEATGNGKPLYPLHMIIGFPRPIQLKRLLRDMAGLGVASVHLTGTELGEKSYMQSSLVERGAAHQLLVDGTVQAGGTHVPELFLHKTLSECIQSVNDSIKNDEGRHVKMTLDNINPSTNLTDYLKQNPVESKNVIAAIGSERGWTDKERRLLEENGFIRLGMGCRIMRTETAATVSASIILSEMGVLQ